VKFLCIYTSDLVMKTKAICSFFVLFAIVAGIGTITPAAFADESQGNPHNIETADNDLAVPGCGETEVGCYTPNTMTVDVGHTITMTNADEAGIHTFTSGTVDGFSPSPDGIFDSGMLMKPGDSFDYLTDTVGEFPYYCTLHVWMQGTLIVQEAAAEEEVMEETMEEEVMEETELVVTITDSVMDDGTHVYLDFSTIHVNYEITATQNGEEIFKEAAHAMEMTGANHHIDAVGSDESPIDIEIVSLGIGPPGANQDWTGPVGTVATTQVVPEFGTIAMMVLAVAIISIVAVTAKSRVIPSF